MEVYGLGTCCVIVLVIVVLPLIKVVDLIGFLTLVVITVGLQVKVSKTEV